MNPIALVLLIFPIVVVATFHLAFTTVVEFLDHKHKTMLQKNTEWLALFQSHSTCYF
jgi:hypothetical protein